MWIERTALVFLVGAFGPLAFGQSPAPVQPMAQTRSSLWRRPMPEEQSWNVRTFLELRQTESALDRPENRTRREVQEAEVEVAAKIDSSLQVNFSVGAEQFNDESQFFIREAFLNYSPLPRWFSVNAGQKLMSVGLLNEQEQLFSVNPPFYERLWSAKKGIDVGVEAEFYPLPNQLLILKGATYSGQLVRPGDGRMQAAERAPVEISLRSRSPYHEAFVARFEHDLAFVDPLVATGIGAQIRSRDRLKYKLEASLFFEAWQMIERQSRAPDQVTTAYFVFPALRWDRFLIGYVHSRATGQVGLAAPGSVRLPAVNHTLWRAEARLASYLSFQIDGVRQSGPEPLRDQVISRLILDWSF